MIEDKQIKELAEAIQANCQAGLFEDEAYMIAEFVINKLGYCKASEIFDDIAKILKHHNELVERDKSEYGELIIMDIGCAIGELKKKYSGKDINVPTKEDKKTCEGCCNIAFRYPYASMYPCINCVRANQKDYYNIPVED